MQSAEIAWSVERVLWSVECGVYCVERGLWRLIRCGELAFFLL